MNFMPPYLWLQPFNFTEQRRAKISCSGVQEFLWPQGWEMEGKTENKEWKRRKKSRGGQHQKKKKKTSKIHWKDVTECYQYNHKGIKWHWPPSCQSASLELFVVKRILVLSLLHLMDFKQVFKYPLASLKMRW